MSLRLFIQVMTPNLYENGLEFDDLFADPLVLLEDILDPLLMMIKGLRSHMVVNPPS